MRMAKVKENAKKQVSKNKKRKTTTISKIKQHIIQVTLLSLIIFAVIFCIYKIIKLLINPTESFLIEQGIIEQSESVTGYVIREETVVKGENYKNGMVTIKNEGERVSKNDTIFCN